MWEYSVFLVNKKIFLMWEFFFLVNEVDDRDRRCLEVFFPDFISCIIYFIVKKKRQKNVNVN